MAGFRNVLILQALKLNRNDDGQNVQAVLTPTPIRLLLWEPQLAGGLVTRADIVVLAPSVANN